MKEIILCLVFLMVGIYSNSKLNLFESIMLFVISILLDNYLILKRTFPNDRKVKYQNYKALYKDIAKSFNIYRLILIIFFFTYGFASSYLINNHKNKLGNDFLNKAGTYEGVIVDVAERPDNYRVKIYIRSIKENVEIYIDKNNCETLLPGYHLTIKGTMSKLDPLKNYGSYDSKEYKKHEKIFYNFYGSVTEVKKGKIFFITNLYRFKNKICKIYDSILDEKYSGIVKAMIVGESSMLDEDIKTLYKNSGVFHILAISGMHVGIISMALKVLLKKIKGKENIKKIFLVSILFGYTLLTGASISTLRAFLMLTFSELAELFNKDYKSTYGLALSAIVILIINPTNLFNMSFILSFGAICAMKVKLDLPYSLESQASNISVFAIMTPIIIFNFYNIQGLSIIANIFILPLTSILVISCIVCLIFYCINSNVSFIIGKIITYILTYYEEVLKFLSELPFYNNITGKMSILTISLWYVIYYFILNLSKNKNHTLDDKRKKLKHEKLLCICIVLFIILLNYKNKNVLVTFIDVGHGDSILIYDEKENRSMLIDGGGSNGEEKDKGTYNVYPYLKYLGLTEIDLAVVTHTDRDHIKGIIELIDIINIRKIALPYGDLEGSYYESLIKKCEDKNISIERLKENDEFYVGRVRNIVLAPPVYSSEYDDSFSSNNHSIVIESIYDDKKFLFAGDIEKEIETILLDENSVDKNYYLLKIPHHGSNTSSTKEFVERVNPKYGIIMGSKTNIRNFNGKNVFKYKNTKIIDTYNCGMIIFELKG